MKSQRNEWGKVSHKYKDVTVATRQTLLPSWLYKLYEKINAFYFPSNYFELPSLHFCV